MILALDPGETTGIALRDNQQKVWVSMAKEREQIWRLIGALSSQDQVVIEDFVTAGRISKHGLYTVRLIGGVEALCWRKNIPFRKQVPAYRTSWLVRAEKLRPARSRYEERHEKDALAHLLAHEGEMNGRQRGREDSQGQERAVRRTCHQLQQHCQGVVDHTQG